MAWLTKAKQEEFLQHLRAGMRRGAATDAIFQAEDPSSGKAAKNRRRVREFIIENHEFQLAVLDAEVEATEHVEEALYQAAISGSVSAAKAWLDLKGFARSPAATGRAQPTEPEAPLEALEEEQAGNVFKLFAQQPSVDPGNR